MRCFQRETKRFIGTKIAFYKKVEDVCLERKLKNRREKEKERRANEKIPREKNDVN